MKRILFVILLCCFCATCCAGNVQELKEGWFTGVGHENCYDINRWVEVATNGYDNLLYDSYTVEEENHFIPFADRKIKMWVMYHSRRLHDSRKFLYEINLDNKTITYLQTQSIKDKRINKTLPISPESMEEILFYKALEIYEK